MAIVRWTFEDPSTSEVYVFPINPSDGGSPSYEKNFVYENTSAPDGKVIVFQGRNNPVKGTFSGTILHKEQYDAFVDWFNKKNQIYITDDLGRNFSIIIESFKPSRQRAVHFPWKHSYQVDYTIVDWV
jgi:hypothetical protein